MNRFEVALMNLRTEIQSLFQSNFQVPKTTPWGKPQRIKFVAPGILFIQTACHGGLWLSPKRNADIPLSVKQETAFGHGLHGFYEESDDALQILELLNVSFESITDLPDLF